MAKINYNTENCMKCLCPGCPVQKDSACIAKKGPKWQKMLTEISHVKELEKSQEERQPRCGISMYEEDPICSISIPMKRMSMPIEEEKKIELLKPKDVIGLYCSNEIGVSNCRDLNLEAACNCPSCEVWKENNLHSHHYCIGGHRAKEVS